MKKLLILAFIFFSFPFDSYCQNKMKHNDGPYINIVGDQLDVKWIQNGKKKKTTFEVGTDTIFNIPKLPKVDISKLNFNLEKQTRFDSIERFLAISDIHGQYDLFIEILKNHNVIDSSGHWNYGQGHLVIVGDVFDRGDKVTETLWFLYNLEKDAANHGGKVHVLLGNHEMMVLHGDLRYINSKYRYTTGALQTSYNDLYDSNSFLGQWLRSKNICTVINDIVFVHGGFSKEILEKESSLEKLNSLYKTEIIDNLKIKKDDTDLKSMLYFENGPLWYRGYANPDGFDINQANQILNLLNAKSVVVGHTSMPKIISLHDNKIILIDSSIKFGNSGEVLVYENNQLWRGLVSGEKKGLLEKAESISPFEYVYNIKDRALTLILDTDVKKLIKNKLDEEWQECKLTAVHNEEYNRDWDIRIRARGNMRKKNVLLPPLKLDFPKKTLEYLGFKKNDKLKLVLQGDRGKKFRQGLFRENILYKIYQIIDSTHFRTRLVNIQLKTNKKKKFDLIGFVIEDNVDFAIRNKGQLIEDGIIRYPGIERNQYLKMVFFQYMICNTDWGLYNKHNVKIIQNSNKEVNAIPYDFDYAGIVGMDYAVPHDRIPVNDVTQAFFRGKEITQEEIEMMLSFFNQKKDTIYDIICNDENLSKGSKKRMVKFIDKFYETLSDKKKWEDKFITPKSLVNPWLKKN